MKKIAVIINPKAGSNNKKLLKEVIEKLSVSHQLTIFETNKPGDATEIAKKECSNFDLFAVAGGDGTIHEVINGINNSTPLAIIPIGTANIVAIEAGIAQDVTSICNAINQGVTRKAYIHQINKKKFILMAGIGYDAKVVENINPKLKKIFGKFIFIWESFKQFFHLQQFNITVKANHNSYNANWVLFTNAKHYAGNYKITNQTSIFESGLICYLFPHLSKIDFLYNLFLILLYGNFSRSKKIITIKASFFEISAKTLTPIQSDGELCGNLPALIKNNVDTLNLIVNK